MPNRGQPCNWKVSSMFASMVASIANYDDLVGSGRPNRRPLVANNYCCCTGHDDAIDDGNYDDRHSVVSRNMVATMASDRLRQRQLLLPPRPHSRPDWRPTSCCILAANNSRPADQRPRCHLVPLGPARSTS